ncbi:MAG: hypothetical protein VR70_05890 [Rhodospirillaceae bacterium BRH_c57]|nr:MAG: hypothetical protein VR70_05890 [Rhodospirillaceae bacterium BRH_c57]
MARTATARKRKTKPPVAAMEPADWQERHSPTDGVVVAMPIPGTVRTEVHQCQRRRSARIMAELTDNQARAAQRIYEAFKAITLPVSSKIASYDPPTGRGECAEWSAFIQDCVRDYKRWADACADRHVDEVVVLAITVHGMSLEAAEQQARKRRGHARETLIAGLDLYCKINRLG